MPTLIHEEIDSALADWGEHPAIMDATPGAPRSVVSAAELRQSVREAAAFLTRSGIAAGVPVALVLDNSIDFVRLFLALLRIGALPVPLRPEYRLLELREIFANARAGAVVAEEAHLPALAEHLEGRIVIVCRAGSLRLDREAGGPPEPAQVGPEVASLNYTYRGLGYPLGSMATHAQYFHGARVLQEGLQGRAGERMLSVLPMPHIFPLVGCVLVPLLYRMTIVVARTLHPRHLFRIIEEAAIDYVTAVPEIYLLLARVKEEGTRLPSLEALVSGGSALDAEGYELVRRSFGVEVLHGYGLTEFAPASRNVRGAARPGTMGPLCDSVEARIDGVDDRSAGEILLRTPWMSAGYYRRPRETAEAFRNGWLHTGDVGRLDGDHLIFVGEKKRTCKVNGSMVDLEEVERALRFDPHVAGVQATLDDGVLTARIAVCPGVDAETKVRQLRASLRGHLSEHKVPVRMYTTVTARPSRRRAGGVT